MGLFVSTQHCQVRKVSRSILNFKKVKYHQEKFENVKFYVLQLYHDSPSIPSMQLERWENEVFQILLALSKYEAAISRYISNEIEKLRLRFLSLISVVLQT